VVESLVMLLLPASREFHKFVTNCIARSDAAAQDYVDAVADKFSKVHPSTSAEIPVAWSFCRIYFCLCPALGVTRSTQLSPWLLPADAEGDSRQLDDDSGNEWTPSDCAHESSSLRRFQGPIQMSDGARYPPCFFVGPVMPHFVHGILVQRRLIPVSLTYSGSVYNDHCDSNCVSEFPSLDSSNFPALPKQLPPRDHCPQDLLPLPPHPRGTQQPIILEFATPARAHRLEVSPCARTCGLPKSQQLPRRSHDSIAPSLEG
jgi:hypothetical protein